MAATVKVKVKKKCCKSRPRCRRCPVVMMRLCEAGLAERESKRRFLVQKKISKRRLRKARA